MIRYVDHIYKFICEFGGIATVDIFDTKTFGDFFSVFFSRLVLFR